LLLEFGALCAVVNNYYWATMWQYGEKARIDWETQNILQILSRQNKIIKLDTTEHVGIPP